MMGKILHGYICECSDTKCQARVRMTHAEFLRLSELGHVLAPGHTVVEVNVRGPRVRASYVRRGGVRVW